MPSYERKRKVLQRHDYRCVYCGERLPAEELTVDHVEPRVKGGDHSRGNLVAACWPCNKEKGGQPAWAYLEDRPEKRANFLRLARFVWPRLRTAVEEAARQRAARDQAARDQAARGDAAGGEAAGGDAARDQPADS